MKQRQFKQHKIRAIGTVFERFYSNKTQNVIKTISLTKKDCEIKKNIVSYVH